MGHKTIHSLLAVLYSTANLVEDESAEALRESARKLEELQNKVFDLENKICRLEGKDPMYKKGYDEGYRAAIEFVAGG